MLLLFLLYCSSCSVSDHIIAVGIVYMCGISLTKIGLVYNLQKYTEHTHTHTDAYGRHDVQYFLTPTHVRAHTHVPSLQQYARETHVRLDASRD